MGTMPGTVRIEPSRPSSPMKANPSRASVGMASVAAKRPTAMARSRPAPALRTPDGARFTVTRLVDHRSPLDRSAARTRSRDSRHAPSGWPTMVKPGSPSVILRPCLCVFDVLDVTPIAALGAISPRYLRRVDNGHHVTYRSEPERPCELLATGFRLLN